MYRENERERERDRERERETERENWRERRKQQTYFYIKKQYMLGRERLTDAYVTIL